VAVEVMVAGWMYTQRVAWVSSWVVYVAEVFSDMDRSVRSTFDIPYA